MSFLFKMISYMILSTILLTKSSVADTAVFFTPSNDCRNQIIQNIESATDTINIVMFSFTDKKIADSLIRSKEKGVKVHVLTDEKQSNFFRSAIKHLLNAKIDVRFHKTDNGSQEHNKFAIFDNKTVSTGSMNWTYQASNHNNENCLFITGKDDEKTILKYSKQFEILWEQASDKFDYKYKQ